MAQDRRAIALDTHGQASVMSLSPYGVKASIAQYQPPCDFMSLLGTERRSKPTERATTALWSSRR